MTSDISVLESPALPVQDQPVEIVERKGRGHPDTICDAVSEQVSLALAAAYRKAFGRILHYSVDKGLLVAGEVACRFGGGRVPRSGGSSATGSRMPRPSARRSPMVGTRCGES